MGVLKAELESDFLVPEQVFRDFHEDGKDHGLPGAQAIPDINGIATALFLIDVPEMTTRLTPLLIGVVVY